MILFGNQLMDRSQVNINMEDRGYQFGDGVYEVIRVYNGKYFAFKGHIDRLYSSASKIRMNVPMPQAELEDKLMELLEKNQVKDGSVYLQVSRGVAKRAHTFKDDMEGVLVAYTNSGGRPLKNFEEGISAILMDDIRWLRCDIKSLNLLPNSLAAQEAKERGCGSAIFHRDQVVTEGSSSNVFIVRDNRLVTHPANNLILPGITRKIVIDLAGELGIQVEEKAFSVDELMQAEEVFITSTGAEVTPIIEIDGKAIGDRKPGATTRRIQEAYEKLVQALYQD